VNALGRILVPVDDAESSQGAVALALDLARHDGSEIVFCHSVDLTGAVAGATTPYGETDVSLVFDALEAQSNAFLDGATARAAAAGVSTSKHELAGPPVGAILDAVRERKAGAIVMGTHGRTGFGRMFSGSTADGVIRGSDVPVFVVSEHCAPDPDPGGAFARILVAYDASEAAGAAFALALELSEPGKTEILLAHVLTGSFEDAPAARVAAQALLDAGVARARAAGLEAQTALLEGEPIESLLDLAQARGVSLIAVGTHGRRGLARLVFGSVAEGCVRAAAVPVVVVRERAGGDSA
jgi:nucleotide-binding universal stress UspA family protein